MTDNEKELITLLGHSYFASINLIRANEAATVEVPQDVLDQGSTAQFPAEEPRPEPTPPAPAADKGKSDSSPDPRKQNRQAPSA